MVAKASAARSTVSSRPRGVAVPATFLLSNDKRTAIEFAIEHLGEARAHAASTRSRCPTGRPFGEIVVDEGQVHDVHVLRRRVSRPRR
mgnify:CR=1 FL=1